MVSFVQTIKDIKTLKIQGSHAIAKASLLALRQKAYSLKAITKSRFLHEIYAAKLLLFASRPTEPCMRNCINYALSNLDAPDLNALKKEFYIRVDQALMHIESAEQVIADIGSRKIRDGMVIFTHCHSSTVISILKAAKLQNKKFEVHNTETRPRLQGRITAVELALHSIPVTHFVDAAARYALKKSDLMLIGADAITTEGKVINKIGSELFAEIADKFDIPVYVCADSWKFDPATVFGYEEEMEQRKPNEIWSRPPKGITVNNYAFEKIDTNLVTGIISELGIYKPEIFIEELRRNYTWMFK